jgi:ribosome-binding factor A
MDTTRQNKISRLLQKDLSEIFLLEFKNSFPGALITVTKVRVTSDLSIAKVYLSIFATASKDTVLLKIKEHSKEVRHLLGNRIKNQLRVVPNLEFYIDDSLDYLENIENLLKQ